MAHPQTKKAAGVNLRNRANEEKQSEKVVSQAATGGSGIEPTPRSLKLVLDDSVLPVEPPALAATPCQPCAPPTQSHSLLCPTPLNPFLIFPAPVSSTPFRDPSSSSTHPKSRELMSSTRKCQLLSTSPHPHDYSGSHGEPAFSPHLLALSRPMATNPASLPHPSLPYCIDCQAASSRSNVCQEHCPSVPAPACLPESAGGCDRSKTIRYGLERARMRPPIRETPSQVSA